MAKPCMTGSLVLAFALLAQTPAWAAVIYDSFQPGDTYANLRGDFGKFGSGYYKQAAAFTAPYDAYLTSIEIALGHRAGPNAMTVSLFSDNAGVPGGAIETFLLNGVVQPMGSPTPVIQVDSTLLPLLAGLAQYWVEVEVVDPALTGMTWWHATDPPVPGRKRALSYSGAPWTVNGRDMAFRVNAVAVPEASAFSLCGIGLLALIAVARGRSRR